MIGIELQRITKVYGSGAAAVPAVQDVSLSVEPGEFFFLLGPSGCGKTTLLRIIAGLLKPSAGRVRFGNRDVTNLPVEKRSAAMVFQNYALWPHMTVQENAEFGPKMQGKARGERRRIAEENLSRVEMAALARRKPNQLSGGQQQRAALARALSAQADCLLLDEPLSNLDARLRLQMRSELRRLVKALGTTAVYVTHDQKEALSMADRVAVMNEGRIAQVGTPQGLYNRPASLFVADFLGEANFIEGRVADPGPPARVETPVGTIAAAGEGLFSAGQPVTVCVRPERIAIEGAAGGDSSAASLPARIESSTYLGEMRQYHCLLAGGPRWKVSVLAGGGGPLPDGQCVRLRVAARDAVLLPKRETSGE